VKTRALDRTRFVNYRGRADEFFRGMLDEAWAERYNAAALLGIHAAIALNDAVAIHQVGKRTADDQHLSAVRLLEIVCQGAGIDSRGAMRLGEIVSGKNDLAYSDRYVATDTDQVQRIRRNVERFFTWAYRNFGFLGPEPAQGG
jgi:hypothetical protein